MKRFLLFTGMILASQGSVAHQAETSKLSEPAAVLADIAKLEAVGAKILQKDLYTGVGLAVVSAEQQEKISQLSHAEGKCGGYEALPLDVSPQSGFSTKSFNKGSSVLKGLSELRKKNEAYEARVQTFGSSLKPAKIDQDIKAAVDQVDAENLRQNVQWLSSYPNRYNKAKDSNQHVYALQFRLQQLVGGAKYPVKVDLIGHQSTTQKSIRVHIEGSQRPNEIIVLGGHLDSINQSFFDKSQAPGADDNASGSSNLIEALRILMAQKQPERSVEIFWYAGEESGLLGSAEIAKQYKSENKDVIAVLQLDMTLFPGNGEFTLGSMRDFTSSWLREYLVSINSLYIGAKIVDDKCGYGCSDHASWHRQGYPALMPFESGVSSMNKRIHSKEDVIDSRLSFAHSAMFSKIALVFAMDLGNSNARQPF